MQRAREAGIPVLGAYHFLWPEDVEAQVTAWMDYVDAQTPWWKDVPWIWQVDAERPKDGVRLPSFAEVGQAVDAVKRRMARNGASGYVVNKFGGDLSALIGLCGRNAGRIDVPAEVVKPTEKILPRGVAVSERELANQMGTDQGGTDCVQLIERVLDKLLPEAQYTSVDMPNGHPTDDERNQLWDNIVHSIDAGYGVVMSTRPSRPSTDEVHHAR